MKFIENHGVVREVDEANHDAGASVTSGFAELAGRVPQLALRLTSFSEFALSCTLKERYNILN